MHMRHTPSQFHIVIILTLEETITTQPGGELTPNKQRPLDEPILATARHQRLVSSKICLRTVLYTGMFPLGPSNQSDQRM
jgi:hypothetical protein